MDVVDVVVVWVDETLQVVVVVLALAGGLGIGGWGAFGDAAADWEALLPPRDELRGLPF